MKFPMYQKETRDKKYQNDPYRAVNFRIDKDGDLLCPNDKKFLFLRSVPVKGNRLWQGRQELFQCEDCSGLSSQGKKICHQAKLTVPFVSTRTDHFHQEVLDQSQLHSTALFLRMNRIHSRRGRLSVASKWNLSSPEPVGWLEPPLETALNFPADF